MNVWLLLIISFVPCAGKKKVNAVNFLSVATGAIVYRTQTFAKKVDYRSVASIISCCANLELSVPPLHVASAKY